MKLTPIDKKCDSMMVGWVNFTMEASTVRLAISAKMILSDEQLDGIIRHKSMYSDAGNLN